MEKAKNTMEEKIETPVQTVDLTLTPDEEAGMRQMMEASVFYGHGKARTNPKMRPHILATRSGMEVINLSKTIEMLDKAKKAIENTVKGGGTVFFVGTTPATKTPIKETAEALDLPYVVERWLGGMFTNFETISERINYFRKLKKDKANGKFEKYTKKERLKLSKELDKLEILFGGVESFESLPALVFIADLKENEIAAREARRMHIPTVALVNTDSDPDLVDFPIPANNRNVKSVALILSHIKETIEKAKAAPAQKKEEAVKAENVNDTKDTEA
jgi:small subunit ribosomal protein S2